MDFLDAAPALLWGQMSAAVVGTSEAEHRTHLAALRNKVLQERRQQLEAVPLLNLCAQPLHRDERPHAQDEVVNEVVWCLRVQ
jgi:hypothetical protein